ncbi:hypothetical protein M9H77_24555 [Catharanthus roseus]|uniref:Uncharacterized protein n=1 Tax=Catharanthus roseus TaxID=4058 RepID=A0ACC0AW04_CATRO|nr:hypothetical protein M9H77_24555 [Catharanthus roseus]
MSFPNNPPPPPHQPFPQRPFFDGGDVGGFWPQFPAGSQNPEFHVPFENGPPFKRSRNSENNPSKFSQFPPAFNPRLNSQSLPGGKGTSHIFYKTRLCAKFFEGNCKNGEHCTFAHGQQDLREPPPNWQELVRDKEKDGGGVGGGGCGSGNWNDDQRIIHKMKICKKFYNGEECPYGEKCNFLHERPNPGFPNENMRFKTEVTRQRESAAISIGTRGPAIENKTDAAAADLQQENNKSMTSNLDATKTKPVFWKTKICSKWEITGHCPFGERCHFAHELQAATARAEAEVPVNSGPIQMNPAAVPATDSAPVEVPVVAPVNEGVDPKISRWKLNRKVNNIYADWIYDDLYLPTPPKTPKSVSGEAEA